MKPLIAAVAMCAAITCNAQSSDKARNAAIADTATTGLGLALGAAEANPLGLLTVAMKLGMMHGIAELPEDQRAVHYAVASSMWSGAAANNLCVIASILTGGGFAPVCLLAGIGWGMKTWRESEDERIFWTEGCPMLRSYSQMPELVCVYTPVAQRMKATQVAGSLQGQP